MAWTPLRDRLHSLPLILAGPILRRTEPRAVTVWLALRTACHVTLNIYETDRGEGATIGSLLLAGSRETVSLGEHLHLVAVTARADEQSILLPGQIYAYDLQLEPADRNSPAFSPQTLQQALNAPGGLSVSVSYFEHRLPTFSLPPTELNQLQIVHGSCRKPHGKGNDALAILDDLIAHRADRATARPHQLFLTGDQIYGDDVADPLLWFAIDTGDTLLGWQERLPIAASDGPAWLKPDQLPPGQRSAIAETAASFTAGLPKQPQNAKSHLFSLGEYCATYLLAWSPALWTELPKPREVCRKPEQFQSWQQEVKELKGFVHALWKVRRSLANVPTYMIFDDHDISDDWNLNQAWCLRVLAKPLGRRTVQNGLLAYALFQAWGNTPDQFDAEQVGEKLLTAAIAWSASAGKDPDAEAAIARYVGLPPQDPLTGLPQMRQDRDVLVLAHDDQALTWHYTIRSACHEVIVLDTRTWRGYPIDAATADPPMLLSPSAFDRQLRQPLQQADPCSVTGKPPVAAPMVATLIVAPTNLVSLELIDRVQQWNADRRQMFKNDAGDAWNLHAPALAKLLTVLFEHRDRVVVLSGDIHYGSAVCFTHWSYEAGGDRAKQKVCEHVLAQLTSSALKNAELKTQIIHTKLKLLLPERSRGWLGWSYPFTLQPVPVRRSHPQAQINRQQLGMRDDRLPDWSYRIDWIDRQAAQIPAWASPVTWLPRPKKKSGWQRLRHWISYLWRNRWLQDGSEVVGLPNLGVVQFAGTGEGHDRSVTQSLYWYTPWRSRTIAFSQFCVCLESESESKK